MLDFILSVFKIYLPIILGGAYVLGYQRKKLDSLLKFFIISIHLSLFQHLIEASFSTTTLNLLLVPLYIYLTMFNYAYSAAVFDILCAPLFGIMMDSYENICKNVEKERIRVKVYADDPKAMVKSREGFVEGLLVDTFRPDTILLLN